MTYPAKLTILRALTETLKGITPANGYVSDLSDFDPGDGALTARVYRGRAFFGDNDPVPMVSILEALGEADYIAEPHQTVGVSEYWWSLILQGWVKDDKDNPTDPAYVLLADVRRCLALQTRRRQTNDPSETNILGLSSKLIHGLRTNTGVVRPANELSMYAGFHLLVEVKITDIAETPYV